MANSEPTTAAAAVVLAQHTEIWPLQRVLAYKRNPRRHSDAQVDRIIASILEFGFVNPIAVSSSGTIIAGHGRLMAAQKMGLATVPVIILDHLSEAAQRAYRIADNRVAEDSEWDESFLRTEMAALEAQNFDLESMAFDDEELARLLAPAREPAAKPSAPDPERTMAPPEEPTSRLGDLWILGGHRLLCGDCLHPDQPSVLMMGKRGDMVFTDPPYNVDYEGYTEEALTIQGDAMSEADFKIFLRNIFRVYRTIVKQNASLYVCHPSSWQRHFENAIVMAGFKVRTQIIWAKNTFAWGHGRYKFQHEPIFYAHVDGQSDRWFGDKSQATLWMENKPSANRIHPTAKPVELIERALVNSTKKGDIVIDLFGGSGSTLIACEIHGRDARLMEIEPRYADAIVRRWEMFTNKQARLADGTTFQEVSVARQREKSAAAVAPEAGAA